IGSLLYLTASRPDISFSVGVCARYQSCPREIHLGAVKRIFKYLKGTMDIGLGYPTDGTTELIGYSDSDYAGSLTDRRSTSGSCQFLGNSLISWFSKKQTSVALSTAEAEYIAVGSCSTQLVWLKAQLKDYGNFTTIVNGNVIFVSQGLLARVLQLPTAGFSVFSDADYSQLNFYPQDTLKQMTRGLGQPLVSALPENLQILHYFITRLFLPRSEQRYMVTELDTWIMYNATKGTPLDFSALMFSTMVKFGDHKLTGALPFAPEISVLLLQLGIPLHGRLLSVSPFDVVSENGVYAALGFPRSVNVSGGDKRQHRSTTTATASSTTASSSSSMPKKTAEEEEVDLLADRLKMHLNIWIPSSPSRAV
ncbi:Secreted RxLR effector protein 161, partial [Linum grandiflorum]